MNAQMKMGASAAPTLESIRPEVEAEWNIPFSRVDCQGNEKKYVNEVIDSGWLTTAAKTFEFEHKFAELVGCKYAIAVNSCTSALHLALEAAGVSRDDEVFVPSLTFTASAEVIRYMGGHPVLLDVDVGTSSLSPKILMEAIEANPGVKYLVAVHFGGRALEMFNTEGTGIQQICDLNGIQVIEDAAHALPSLRDGQYVGSKGKLTCFSFYANKTMTTGEGGMLTTNDENLALRARLMRLHGIDRDVWKRFSGTTSAWEYDVVAPGFKYNMPDLCAAVGLAQLERLQDMRDQRQRCAQYYYSRLASCPSLQLPTLDCGMSDHSWHLFPILLTDSSPIQRNAIIPLLNNAGIGTSVHYKPLHRLTYYRDTYKLQPEHYPNAEKIWQNTLSLPIYSLMKNDELEYVADKLLSILAS